MRMRYYILFIYLLSAALSAQFPPVRFEHLSVDQGLSQSSVLAICQDTYGFMWFGTYEGLNRYDGYQFKVYHYQSQDSTSLSQNVVRNIVVDARGTLWFATEGGLNRYNRETDNFTRYIHDPDDPNSLADNRLRHAYIDPSGELWISTDNGLSHYISGKDHFENYRNDPDRPGSLSNSRVRCAFTDRNGIFWAGTDEGLNRMTPGTGEFDHFFHHPDDPNSLSDDLIMEINEDHTGMLWIGTWGGGLCRYDPERNRFIRYKSHEGKNRLSHDIVRAIYEDSDHNLWIGTYGGGLNLYNRESDRFIPVRKNAMNSGSLSSDAIFDIYEDRSGIIWVGTEFGGISKMDRRKTQFENYLTDSNDKLALTSNTVNTIIPDMTTPDDVVWVGTWGSGLIRYNLDTDKITQYLHNPEDPQTISSDIVRWVSVADNSDLWIGTEQGLSHFNPHSGKFVNYPFQSSNEINMDYDNVFTVIEDARNEVWVGSYYGGLHRFNQDNGSFIRYPARSGDSTTINDYIVWTIYEDRSGILWIGTETGGLNRYDPATKCFKAYQKNKEDPLSISDNKVLCIFEDQKGILWVGTTAGLNRMDRTTETFRHYTTDDGFPSNSIQGILEDDNGDLWISTTHGILRFNEDTGNNRYFSMSDGLPSNEFYVNSCSRGRDGVLFFGGINGFTAFNPGEIHTNSHIPPIVITDLKIYNESIPIGLWKNHRRILEKNIIETREIVLNHFENVISFEFAALDFTSPSDNGYAYILEPLESDWNDVGNRHYATYSHLPAGQYLFRVKGSNNSNVWNEEGTEIRIIIKPAIWNSNWFRWVIFLVISAMILTVHQLRIHAVRSRNIRLSKMNKMLNDEIQERKLAESKVQTSLKEKEVLLKEIHHRVKNNMQIICSLLSLQSSRIEDPELLEIFNESQNRVRAMALIHERLYKTRDLHRINFNSYLRDLTQDLLAGYLGNSHDIGLKTEIDQIHLPVNQAVPCGLVINELVSNAIKYAFPDKNQKEKAIRIKMFRDNGNFILTVEDNGVGLLKNSPQSGKDESLGLKLVDILVQQQLHGKLTWEVNHGTHFRIAFEEKKWPAGFST